MNLNGRLDRIEKQIVVYTAAGIPAELMEKAARIFDPSNDDWFAACDSIAATMPEKYQETLHADLDRLRDLNVPASTWETRDHYSGIPQNRTGKPYPAPLTQRFFELVELRIYQCPRPLALPEAFCRVLTELEPLQWLDFSEHCENCLLQHPHISYHVDRRIEWHQMFYECVLCGGPVKWLGISHYSRPCHVSKGSAYSLAVAQQWPDSE